MAKMIELNHEIEDGMITYRGLPAPIITDYLSREGSRKTYAAGTEFHIGRIEMIANTGTYLDTPFHRYERGTDLAAVPLESLANLQAIVVRAVQRSHRGIGPEVLPTDSIQGKAVLFHTGWDQHWRTDRYYENHPFLTKELAEVLVRSGVSLVGIDSFNIDDTADLTRPVHSTLLGAAIPIVEHMCNLQDVPDVGFRFFAVPPRIKRFGTFPVRAFAILE